MFFTDITDFKKYCSVNAAFDLEEATIFLNEVERLIFKKHLGADFLAELQEAFDDGLLEEEEPEEDEIKIKQAIELIRVCSPYFALVRWAPSGQLSIDSGGIRIASSENYKTAFQWQIKDLLKAWNESAMAGLDELLEYLEANLETFDTYAASDEFKSNKELFVNSSKILVKYFSAMNGSRITFQLLKSIIRKVEDFEIKAVLLPDYYAELKEKWQNPPESVSGSDEDPDPLSDADKKIIEMAQPAIVHLTIARAIRELSASLSEDGFLQFDNSNARDTIDTKKQPSNGVMYGILHAAEKDGRTYLKQMEDYLEAHKEDYETFTEDAEYVAPDDDVAPNSTDMNLFNAT